jgi:molybdopterin/thiamine biosynthesis adenylyltransferase
VVLLLCQAFLTALDTIDVSNLNRQFLFRQADVGHPKAEVAAKFVEKRVKGVKITPYCGKIQDKDEDYYMQFGLVICGLDSIEARRWINATLVAMVDEENPDSLKPLIDGGTEGMVYSISPKISPELYRIQRTIESHPSDHDLLYGVPAGYACASRDSSTLYIGHNPSTTSTLH